MNWVRWMGSLKSFCRITRNAAGFSIWFDLSSRTMRPACTDYRQLQTIQVAQHAIIIPIVSSFTDFLRNNVRFLGKWAPRHHIHIHTTTPGVRAGPVLESTVQNTSREPRRTDPADEFCLIKTARVKVISYMLLVATYIQYRVAAFSRIFAYYSVPYNYHYFYCPLHFKQCSIFVYNFASTFPVMRLFALLSGIFYKIILEYRIFSNMIVTSNIGAISYFIDRRNVI
jgi:hypothetical protein